MIARAGACKALILACKACGKGRLKAARVIARLGLIGLVPRFVLARRKLAEKAARAIARLGLVRLVPRFVLARRKLAEKAALVTVRAGAN